MCQACQNPDKEIPHNLTISELNEIIDCLNSHSAEQHKVIEQLIYGAIIIIVTLCGLGIILAFPVANCGL